MKKRCECIYEPRGDNGLEGYQLGDQYDCEYIGESPVSGMPYYRVYPTCDTYYETCSVRTFRKYFKEVGYADAL